MLRIKGQTNPDWLVENHRLYLAGELRTHADLVRLLALKISKKLVEVEEGVSHLIARLDDLVMKTHVLDRNWNRRDPR